jgi:hypothetical protein
MAREGRERGITRKTTTVEHLPAQAGDPIAGAIRAGLMEYARLDLTGFCVAYWEAVADVPDARLDVFKKMGGHFNKLGTLKSGEVESEDLEAHLVTTWRPGIYQLRPIVGNKYYAPSSTQFHVGEEDESSGTAAGRGNDLVGVMNSLTEMGMVKQLKELKEGLLAGERKGDEDGMKAADVQVMLNTALQPLQVMLQSAERRAELAETRNHELQMKLMELANGRQATAQGSIAELMKMLPKEAMAALLSPPDAPGWAEKAIDALREFGPALAQMAVEYFRGAAGAVRSDAAAALPAPGPQPTETAETGGGGTRVMPIQLNPEQIEAKNLLVECIKGRDFANAYAMVENFPGFTPTVNGPMPIGAALLSMIDPAVTKPRIYVIQMMQLVPELKDMYAEADAFVAYIQKRLMDDQEKYLAQQGSRQGGGDPGPRPTTQEGDERA